MPFSLSRFLRRNVGDKSALHTISAHRFGKNAITIELSATMKNSAAAQALPFITPDNARSWSRHCGINYALIENAIAAEFHDKST